MVDTLYANEKPGDYPPSYYQATATATPPFDPLKGDLDVDVCVIGAGFTGLSAALHLRQAGFRVAVLDAHRVGWGASGRNGGQVGTGQRMDQMSLEELMGRDDAMKLWAIAEDAKTLVADLIAEHGIDCGYQAGVMEVNHKRRYSAETRDYVEHLQTHYDYDKVRYVPQDELRSLMATEDYYDGALDMGAGHLHPLRFAFGLARACDAAGVSIFERSEALSVEENARVEVKTAQGRIRADYLVMAVNGYCNGLNKRVTQRVMPINNYIIATEPLGEERARSLIANNAAVADSRFVVNYFRLSDDRRLLFGGRESYRYRFPGDIKSYVRKAMLRVYPQLAEARIDYGWGGVVGVTLNRLPYFEWLSPRMATLGGYSGHGVALATLGGALAAEAIGGVAERFSLMEKMPTQVFPGGGAMQWPLLALGMTYYSLRDKI